MHLFTAATLVGAAVAACVGDDPVIATSPTPDAGGGTTDATVTTTPDSAVAPMDAGIADADGGPVTNVRVTMGGTHACVARSDGSVWCWGSNVYGESGQSPPSGAPLLPTKVVGLSDVVSVSAGINVTCAIKSDATVWCWGENSNGQLGHDPTSGDAKCSGEIACNPTPVQVTGIFARQVVPSNLFTCAVTTSSDVLCWGDNENLSLGVAGQDASTFTPVAPTGLANDMAEIGASYPGFNVCAVDAAHSVWCWGNNKYGQLGHAAGTKGDVMLTANGQFGNLPTRVTFELDGGDDDGGDDGGEAGTTDGGLFDNVAHVTANLATCAVRLDGTVWCWGQNTAAQLGDGVADTKGHPAPAQVVGLANATVIRAGNSFCALQTGGALSCWSIRPFHDGTPGSTTCANFSNNGASATNYCDVTPVALTGLSATEFASDENNLIALDPTGAIVMIGRNDHGQLGHLPNTDGDVLSDASASAYGTSKPVTVVLP